MHIGRRVRTWTDVRKRFLFPTARGHFLSLPFSKNYVLPLLKQGIFGRAVISEVKLLLPAKLRQITREALIQVSDERWETSRGRKLGCSVGSSLLFRSVRNRNKWTGLSTIQPQYIFLAEHQTSSCDWCCIALPWQHKKSTSDKKKYSSVLLSSFVLDRIYRSHDWLRQFFSRKLDNVFICHL